ncbi:MAG: leucyl/phenylalanyl-tRNA--protein transferase [Saprospiraceae bacterium]|nr:MAG: leucyl/phenylalanyl-tRNA--protein transferase [Saprospiraceae bacterium]
MPVFWLPEDELIFPDPELADPNGVLAVGGDLSPERLLMAYQMGIFPWFNPNEPLVWWSPDPRFVLFPEKLKVARSMRPYFNQKKFRVSLDQDFRAVITNCQQYRRMGQGGGGTWITRGMLEAYCRLHELGYAHSVEVWKGEALVGGLYGIALGKIFYGESMFAKESNASKFGFISLVKILQKQGYWLIDCQQETRHLESLGGERIDRKDFLSWLEKNQQEPTLTGNWKDVHHT